ncbi:hypothetical protein L3Q82_025655 [Scortum barcoo]|uniref:Uncharacterized protein n=1 Tax=Scortum barcoo TaxID=214431 RepID=A0ACB8WMG7_9TELE|nr:hypothetical protein L3Q82_025655 [Scortum barcoo]
MRSEKKRNGALRQLCASVSEAHRRASGTGAREPRVTANLHVTAGEGGREGGGEGGGCSGWSNSSWRLSPRRQRLPPRRLPAPAPVPAPAPPGPVPEPRVGNPERFTLEIRRAAIRSSRTAPSSRYALQPQTFSHRRRQKLRCHQPPGTGRARLWGTAEWERRTPAALQRPSKPSPRSFAKSSHRRTASGPRCCYGGLLNISQGNRTVQDFLRH